jgi:pimeloyl-ACP methyl ester carboxylesterase
MARRAACHLAAPSPLERPMPLIAFARLLFSLLSLVLLGACGYLLWSWYEGELVRDANGVLYLVREDWRLWTGLALLAWSFLGRWVLTPFIAGKDKGPRSAAMHGEGKMIAGASGSQLYVESQGPAGAPVILLTHGWGLDSTIWSYAKRDLAGYRLILWDLPGLGRSKLAKGRTLTLDDFALDLGTVIEQAGDQPVVLVGHSIGGMTIQTFARDHPALFARRVAGVVLVNTTYTNPLKTMILAPLVTALRRPLIEPMMRRAIWLQPLAWLSAWQSYLSGSAHLANRLGFGRYVTRSQLEHTTLLATRNPPAVQAKGNLAMFRWDVLATLPQITKPVLVLGGDVDIVTKLEASRVIAGAIPQARLQVVDGVNHMGFLERSDIYNRAIAEFAADVHAQAEQSPRVS